VGLCAPRRGIGGFVTSDDKMWAVGFVCAAAVVIATILAQAITDIAAVALACGS